MDVDDDDKDSDFSYDSEKARKVAVHNSSGKKSSANPTQFSSFDKGFIPKKYESTVPADGTQQSDFSFEKAASGMPQ